MIALVEAYRSGLLQPHYWLRNLVAGLIVGIVALPLAMAFAIASGVKPIHGLYTAIIAGIIVGIFGGSRVQIAGPTGAFVVILSGVTARYGLEGLQVATLMAGVILMVMGFAKIGRLIQFIPAPVIVGFTSGIAVIIFMGAWKDFFGLAISPLPTEHFHTKFLLIITALPTLNFQTTFLACLSLSIIVMTPKLSWLKHIPGSLMALMITTIIHKYFNFSDIVTIGDIFGEIPQQLPSVSLPSWNPNQWLELFGPAFTIALLGAIESLLSAVVADGMGNTRHQPNQELIGQGLANILCPLFGGFAATGAIARTATNIRSGGNSPLASIVHSLVLVVVVFLLSPLVASIPLCTLAAVLCVVAYNMSDIHHFVFLLKYAPRHDIFILLATFILTIFTDLVIAVNVGVILALLSVVRRMSQAVTLDLEDTQTLHTELLANGMSTLPQEIVVYTIQGPFFFGSVERLRHELLSVRKKDCKIIIFRLKAVPFMDVTGLEIFQEIIKQLHDQNIQVFLCEANSRVHRKITKINMLPWVQGNCIFLSLSEILKLVCPQYRQYI